MSKVIKAQIQNFGGEMSDKNKKNSENTIKKTYKKRDPANKIEKAAELKNQPNAKKAEKDAASEVDKKDKKNNVKRTYKKRDPANKIEKAAELKNQPNAKKAEKDAASEVDKKDKKNNANATNKTAESVKPVVRFSKIYENKNVREILLKYFEEGCVNILSELNDYIGDEIISNKKNMKAPIIRKWLNLMHDKGIVEFNRRKDKKTGWFTYYWKIRPDKIVEFVISDINKEIEELEKKIEEVKAHNFACDCKTWTYSEALESDFVCPECKKMIAEKDKNILITEITEMENKKKLLEDKRKDILMVP